MRRHLPAIAERMDNQQQEIGNVKRELGMLRNETNDRLDTLNQTMRTGFSLVLTEVGNNVAQRTQQNSEVSRHLIQAAAALTQTHNGTVQQSTITAGNGESASGGDSVPKPFSLHLRHSNATSMYNEWFGLGVFSNKPIEGGIDAAERVHQTAWRRHFNVAENKQFSRLKIVIAAMQQLIISGEDKEKV
jgi:hypothetical protein